MIKLFRSFIPCRIACILPALSSAASFTDETAELRPIDTMGKGERAFQGDEEAVLFEHQGAGCLTHFWFGGNFKGVEDTRIRYYVDDEETPSINMDLYMGLASSPL